MAGFGGIFRRRAKQSPPGTGQAASPRDADPRKAPRGYWTVALLAPPLVGVVGLASYAVSAAGLSEFAVGLLTAAAAFVAGGIFGFLFGLPRSTSALASATAAEGGLRSSTNLEEIVDWLTKILVGLGLASISRVVPQVGQLVDFLAPALGSSGKEVALGVLILFSVSGFLFFYLLTRLRLASAFAQAEEQLRARKEAVLTSEQSSTTLREDPVTAEAKQKLLDLVGAESAMLRPSPSTAQEVPDSVRGERSPGDGDEPAAPEAGDEPAAPEAGDEPAAPEAGEEPPAPEAGEGDGREIS